MIKKELLKIRKLPLTQGMINAARNDIPDIRKRDVWSYLGQYTSNTYHYNYRLFIKASKIGEILKISLWFRESVAAKQKESDYDIYLHKRNAEFITYVSKENRWSNAKLDYLEFPKSFADGNKVWMNRDTSKIIMTYLDNGKTGLDAVFKFQLDVRKDQLRKRERKETDAWDRAQDIVPDIPAGFKDWVKKYPQRMNYIVYEYSRKGVTKGWCSFCEKEVDIEKPKHLKVGTCAKCKRDITYLAKGKSATIRRKAQAQLIQKTDTGVIVRSFEVTKIYERGNLTHPRCYMEEHTRTFYDSYSKHRETYYWENYKQKEMRWISASYWDGCNRYWSYSRNTENKTATYKGTLAVLKSTSLRYSGLREMLLHSNVHPVRFIDVYKIFPEIEKLVKVGLYQTVEDILVNRRETEYIRKGNNPQQILSITKEELKLLIAAGDSLEKLKMLKYMRGRNGATKLTAEQLNKLVEYDSSRRLTHLYMHTTIHKALRYIETQTDFKPGDFADYLEMCEELQYNLDNTFVLFPKDWKRAHDEVSKEHNEREAEIEARKKSKQSLKIEKRYEETKKKYEFSYKGLFIVVPHNALEIITEGHNNHHCVATYVERVADGDTTILFVRKEADKTYYTMEVRDNKIVQCRTKFNQSYTQSKPVKAFVEQFDKKVLEPLRIAENQRHSKLINASNQIDQMILVPAM